MKAKNCEKRLSTSWTVIDDISHEIANEKKALVESLSSLAKKLSLFESAMGEEYYVLARM